jgi:hypothetical protein
MIESRKMRGFMVLSAIPPRSLQHCSGISVAEKPADCEVALEESQRRLLEETTRMQEVKRGQRIPDSGNAAPALFERHIGIDFILQEVP